MSVCLLFPFQPSKPNPLGPKPVTIVKNNNCFHRSAIAVYGHLILQCQLRDLRKPCRSCGTAHTTSSHTCILVLLTSSLYVRAPSKDLDQQPQST